MNNTILLNVLNTMPPQHGIVKLSKLLQGNSTWQSMSRSEHQQFGKFLKANQQLLTNNIHFHSTSSNNDGIYN